MPGDHEPVPAVVSTTANDRHPADLVHVTTNHVRRIAAGILHEHDARDAVFFNRPAIDRPDLGAAQGGILGARCHVTP